jgi:hypothetical protein
MELTSIFWENISAFFLLPKAFNFKLCFCFEIFFLLLLQFVCLFTGIDLLLFLNLISSIILLLGKLLILFSLLFILYFTYSFLLILLYIFLFLLYISLSMEFNLFLEFNASSKSKWINLLFLKIFLVEEHFKLILIFKLLIALIIVFIFCSSKSFVLTEQKVDAFENLLAFLNPIKYYR